VRVAFRVTPVLISVLEVQGAERVKLPLSGSAGGPVDLELPPGIYNAKTSELTVSFGEPRP